MKEVLMITVLFSNSVALDDIASRDAKARSSEREAESLRRELEMMERARESALAENRLGFKYLLAYLLTYLLTHLLTHSITHSLNHLFTYLLTYLLTHSLTHSLPSWSTVLLEKLTGFQLVKKFPAFLWNPKVHYRSHK
jgi:hypothetical protein